eukprot:2808425-Lingulodinium_polyedra.AAC.1
MVAAAGPAAAAVAGAGTVAAAVVGAAVAAGTVAGAPPRAGLGRCLLAGGWRLLVGRRVSRLLVGLGR